MTPRRARILVPRRLPATRSATSRELRDYWRRRNRARHVLKLRVPRPQPRAAPRPRRTQPSHAPHTARSARPTRPAPDDLSRLRHRLARRHDRGAIRDQTRRPVMHRRQSRLRPMLRARLIRFPLRTHSARGSLIRWVRRSPTRAPMPQRSRTRNERLATPTNHGSAHHSRAPVRRAARCERRRRRTSRGSHRDYNLAAQTHSRTATVNCSGSLTRLAWSRAMTSVFLKRTSMALLSRTTTRRPMPTLSRSPGRPRHRTSSTMRCTT